MSPTLRLVSAGAATVAVSFGLARYGYGLLLPDLRAALDLDSATLGLIGSGSFAAYLLATVAAGLLAARLGARRLVVAGGSLAVAGMLIVAAAQSPLALGAGTTFPSGTQGEITDDHTPFMRDGVPAIDLIDFDFPCWHKRCDDMSAVSERSLDLSGEAVLELLRTWR